MQLDLNLIHKDLSDPDSLEPKDVLKRIKKRKWKEEPFKAQNWGIWLHHMGAYVGKIKPAMAYHLIMSASRKKQIVLDPFCGIGTIPLESDILGRKAIGNDLNPYAYIVSKAKFQRKKINQIREDIGKIKINTKNISIKECSEFMKKFYHPDTLKEILYLIKYFKRKKNFFLLGCLLGIVHGHRPGHLSAVTSLVIPYLPREKAIYKEVIPRLTQKVDRMYRNDFPLKTKGLILNSNAKSIPLKRSSVDIVITSPPYFNTLDYSSDNKLRNEFLGVDDRKKILLKKRLIQKNTTYIEEMVKVGIEIKRILKNGRYCIFILGDLHQGKKIINTALEVSREYNKIGYITHGIIEDSMPVNKAIPNKYKRNKLDRILVMTNGPYQKI